MTKTLSHDYEALLSSRPSLKSQVSFTPPFRGSLDLRHFTAQLCQLLQGGVHLLKALRILEGETKAKKARALLSDLSDRIESGSSLSMALKSHPGIFPNYYFSVVEAGENVGDLPGVLRSLGEYLASVHSQKRQMLNAMIYPLFVLFLGGIAFFALLIFVLPNIQSLYAGFEGELPKMTKIVLWASGRIPALFLGLGVLVFLAHLFLKEKMLFLWNGFCQRLSPGHWLIRLFLFRYFSVLHLQLKSGISILRVTMTAGKTLKDKVDIRRLQAIEAGLSQGKRFTTLLHEQKFISSLQKEILSVGEETGKIPESLEYMLREMRQELDDRLQVVMRLLEPVMTLIIGVVIGVILISCMLPILQINQLIR
ncbi:MAG: type II secretion system F family protein [Candidatus Omnitrophota bacterium]